MNFIYSKEVEIPEEIKRQYPDYKHIEVVLGGVDESFFKEYANGTVMIVLAPKKDGEPYQMLVMLSRLHDPDIESLTQYVDAIAGNERFLIDTLTKRVVAEIPGLAVNGSEA